MCTHHSTDRNPLNCILPPYMLDQIAANGSAEQRARAEQTQTQSALMRKSRVSLSGEFPVAPAGVALKKRLIYTADFGSGLPGRLLRAEGAGSSGDASADEAYDGAGATYDLYWDVYQRNSIDGRGMDLISTVHYQRGYDNAFWNGQQMVYGDGDEDLPEAQRLFNRFTIALDVIGHELTHGVTQFTANLTYANQPGALNESMSDVFGSLVKQRLRGQNAAAADWIIGEGLFTSHVNGVGIRSMKAPGTAYNDPVLGKDPQPAHMSNYVNTTSDSGGVHTNSGIPNHAFYLIALEIGGFAWEKAGQIWYVTLRDKIRAGTTFQNAADLTYASAGELYGVNSLEQLAVKHGWAGVGIQVGDNEPIPPDPTPNPGCMSALLRLFSGK
jgi:Zn-dependent metalloprotease